MDTITTLFWISLAVTLASVTATILTGWTRRRRVHLWIAPVTIVLLAVTIVLAEQMGRARLFPKYEMGIHLFFAKTAAALVAPVIGSGIALLLRTRAGDAPRLRRLHLACVLVFLLFAVTAVATGIWVFSLSSPR